MAGDGDQGHLPRAIKRNQVPSACNQVPSACNHLLAREGSAHVCRELQRKLPVHGGAGELHGRRGEQRLGGGATQLQVGTQQQDLADLEVA